MDEHDGGQSGCMCIKCQLWNIETGRLPPDEVGTFTPVDVLYEFDHLSTFTCKAKDNGLLLAHFCDEEDGERRFIVAPTTEAIVEKLKQGRLPIRSALEQARLWFVDLTCDGKPLRAFATTVEAVPQDCLPARTARLQASPDPDVALSLRVIDRAFPEVKAAAMAEDR